MTAAFGMLGSVTVRRAVAAKRYAAFLAGAQMNPTGSNLNAFCALKIFRMLNRLDSFDVGTRGWMHWRETERRLGCRGNVFVGRRQQMTKQAADQEEGHCGNGGQSGMEHPEL